MSEPANTTSTSSRRQRQTARTEKGGQKPAAPAALKAPSRLNQLQDLLTRQKGATIAEMVEATGWQPHSVRGAMAGALKKRGLIISSQKHEGVRRYRAEQPV